MPRIALVIPTFNERENVEILIPRIFLLGVRDLQMLVVDDNSSDGTGEALETLSRRYPIQVINRPEKQGLGTAYTMAFKTLLQRSTRERPDYIIQMDADMSHDQNVIPTMLEQIENHDIILGSRYIPGGRIENWESSRRFLSKAGNLYARIILGVPYRDITSGFKCYRRQVLENIDLDSLNSVGYNFQIETIYKAHKKGFRISEIPITFTERRVGVSKMNFPIILESFWKVLKLRFGK